MDCDSNWSDEPRLSLAYAVVTNTYELAEQRFWVNIKSSATALDFAIAVCDQAPSWSTLKPEHSSDIVLLKPVPFLSARHRDLRERLQSLKLGPNPSDSTICLEPETSLLEYFQGELSEDHIHVLVQLPPRVVSSSQSNVSDEHPAKRPHLDQGAYFSNHTTVILMPSYLANSSVALEQWDTFRKSLWKKGPDAFDAYIQSHKSDYYGTFETMPNDPAFELENITALLIREEWKTCWEQALKAKADARSNFIISGHPGIGRCILLTLLLLWLTLLNPR